MDFAGILGAIVGAAVVIVVGAIAYRNWTSRYGPDADCGDHLERR